MDESLKIQMQYLSSRGPEVPRLSEDLVKIDEPYCDHPLCTPPSKRKNIFSTATKQIKSSISSFIPTFKKSSNKVESRKISSISRREKTPDSSKLDRKRQTSMEISSRRPLSISAPNTPLLRHKRAKDINSSALHTTNTFKPIQTNDKSCISIANNDGTKRETREEYPKSPKSESKKMSSSSKYSISSIKKDSFDSKYGSSDVKAVDIKFSDYIQHRKNSQKKLSEKLAPPSPSPRSSPKQRKTSRHRAVEGQKSIDSKTSTGTSTTTSPRIISKNPCQWSGNIKCDNGNNSKPLSLSNPATPLLQRRTTKARKEWDMQTKVDLKELNRVGSKALNNDDHYTRRKSEKIERRRITELDYDNDTENIPPLSPIPRRRHLGAQSRSSPNCNIKQSLDGTVQRSFTAETIDNRISTNISGNEAIDIVSSERSINAIISTHDKMEFDGGRIASEHNEENDEATKSLPCTPFQTRKSSRRSKSSLQQYKPLNIMSDQSLTFEGDKNKNKNYENGPSDPLFNSFDSTNPALLGTSPRSRKRSSVIDPEQFYSEQRKSDSKKSNIVVSHVGAPPLCRRVSRTVMTASPDYESCSGGTNNGNDLVKLEMKKIYLFVADAETQTDDLNSIYGSQPIIPESPEMNESNVFKHVQNEAEVRRKQSTEDVINEKKLLCPSPKHLQSEGLFLERKCEVIPNLESGKSLRNRSANSRSAFKPIRKDTPYLEAR